MASVHTLKGSTGTTLLDVDDSGNLTIAGSLTQSGPATGITNLTATGNTTLGDAAADTVTVTGHMDIDSDRTTAGSGLDIDGRINSASAAFSSLDITAAQLTTARSSGTVNGAKIATTSLAGDTGSVVYADLRCAAPTDGGGTVVHSAIVVEAGHDVCLDVSACATGEADIVIGDNLASALQIREGANAYMTCVSTNSAERMEFDKRTNWPIATINMNDAAVVLTTATFSGNVLLVDPESTGAGEDLTLPSPTTYRGFYLGMNVGGENVVVKDHNGSTLFTAAGGRLFLLLCSGSAWVGNQID